MGIFVSVQNKLRPIIYEKLWNFLWDGSYKELSYDFWGQWDKYCLSKHSFLWIDIPQFCVTISAIWYSLSSYSFLLPYNILDVYDCSIYELHITTLMYTNLDYIYMNVKTIIKHNIPAHSWVSLHRDGKYPNIQPLH